MWVLLAQLVIAYIVASALTPSVSAQQKQAEALKDINFPQAEEGTPQAVIFGDCWSGDWTILAIGRYRTEAITKTQDSGK